MRQTFFDMHKPHQNWSFTGITHRKLL